MITRDELMQIYYLERELKMWEEKLEVLRSQVYTPPSSSGSRPTTTSDKTGRLATDIADTSIVVEDILKRIRKATNDIYRAIESIDDSVLRQIVHYRCIELMSWIKVGRKMNLAPDTARMIFNRAFPKK